jgi:hypothetical protein
MKQLTLNQLIIKKLTFNQLVMKQLTLNQLIMKKLTLNQSMMNYLDFNQLNFNLSRARLIGSLWTNHRKQLFTRINNFYLEIFTYLKKVCQFSIKEFAETKSTIEIFYSDNSTINESQSILQAGISYRLFYCEVLKSLSIRKNDSS